jgi:hypothetical protein
VAERKIAARPARPQPIAAPARKAIGAPHRAEVELALVTDELEEARAVNAELRRLLALAVRQTQTVTASAFAYNPDEPRDAHGEWTSGGGEGDSPATGATGRAAKAYRSGSGKSGGKGGKEKGSEEGVEGGDTGLPVKPWEDPPERTGQGGGKAGGYTAIGITNTQLGDSVENALQTHFGMSNEHPDRRQGPLDVTYGSHGYEVKAVTREASEYKAKPKASEVASKVKYAEEHNLTPHTMIVVHDSESRMLYAYSKPGIGAYRLTTAANGWSFHGKIPFDVSHLPEAAAQTAAALGWF